VRGSTRACWHHPYHERERKTPTLLLVERMKKTMHTYSLNSYIRTHTCARKTRQKKNYDEKQENRVKEGIFFARFFLSFFSIVTFVVLDKSSLSIQYLSLFIFSNWTTDNNLSNHVTLSCIMNLIQILCAPVVLFLYFDGVVVVCFFRGYR
jgi:hypothetical protein